MLTTVRTGDIDTRCLLAGPADGPPVLLSHSLASDHTMWAPQIDALVAAGYRVIACDTRGHGASGAPAGAYSLPGLAADALALLDALGVARAHWVGLSLGGMIGQQFALDHPQRLASLALCDTACRVPPEGVASWEERIRTVAEQGLAPLVEPTLERWFSPAFRAASPAEVARIGAIIRTTPPAGYAGCGQAIKTLDLAARLGAIRLPTLVIVGEEDSGTPVAAARAIANAISGARLVILPGARHLSNIEAAPGFNAALLGHLGEARDR